MVVKMAMFVSHAIIITKYMKCTLKSKTKTLTSKLCFKKQVNLHTTTFYNVMHLQCISGHPGGRGGTLVICTMMFTNAHYPKPRKLLMPLPWGQRTMLCQIKRCNISKEFCRRNHRFLTKNIVAM